MELKGLTSYTKLVAFFIVLLQSVNEKAIPSNNHPPLFKEEETKFMNN